MESRRLWKQRQSGVAVAGSILGCLFLLLSSLGSPVQAAGCGSSDGWVGPALGNPVRAELAALPGGRTTGRQLVRYLVRLTPECLLSNGLRRVESMRVDFSNERLLRGGICTPPAAGREVRILYGTVPAGRPVDVRELHRETARVGAPEQVFHFQRPLTVSAATDVILGVEVRQEAGECPLLYAGPFESESEESGSYLQIVSFEYHDHEGDVRWHPRDCNQNRIRDADEGYAFRVSDREPQRNCGLSFRHDDFQWLIRAGGARQNGGPDDRGMAGPLRVDGEVSAPVRIGTRLAAAAGESGG